MLSQHATTDPESQLEELVGLGAADATMAMERALRMVANCILGVLGWKLKLDDCNDW